MKNRYVVMLTFIVGISFSQVEMNFSLESKYGNGKEVKPNESSIMDYSYLENILDVNTYFGQNIYAYAQLEYSDPPVYGYNRTGIDSMLTTFYVEYSHDKFNVKLGDLLDLYGRGLVFYTFQDQNIDYDNGISGLSLKYFLRDNLTLSSLMGTGKYAFRSNPTRRITDYELDANAFLGSINYENRDLGFFQFTYLFQQSIHGSDLIEDIYFEQTEIGEELNNRCNLHDCTNSNESDTVTTKNINFNWNHFMGPFDIYLDKSWIYYDKIYGDEVFGSRFYTSIYAELLGAGITYEYKNYHVPYLLKFLSNPPIAYREGTSILASRNAHSMNFGNEVGHQIDINKTMFNDVNVSLNLSLAHRQDLENRGSIQLMDVLSMKEENDVYVHYPFRQIYLEMNGWTLSDQLYYKLGLDDFTEFTIVGSTTKQTYATTIPTQWVWKFNSGNSLTVYFELQNKTEKILTDNQVSNETKYDNYYISSSYGHGGKLVLSCFYDLEIKDDESETWVGADLSYELTTETLVSFFYGSQKGGLVCANGICAEQPGFEDGYKITFRSLF